MSFSILILTLNEENNIQRCLDAVSWCDDIVILDSYSSDRTLEIAQKAGARIYQRKFDCFAAQRNYAIDHIDFQYEWLFHLDADEIFTDQLRNEIESRIATEKFDAYRIPSKMIFHDKWLRFSATYPTYQVRLGKLKALRFEQVGHGQREGNEPLCVETIVNPYLHYSFSKGIFDWFEKHNRYSSQEAEEAIHFIDSGKIKWSEIFSRDPVYRRRALKELSFLTPFRPVAKFIYMYILRGGFLDGIMGLHYCILHALYEYMICLKIKEIKRLRQNPQWV